MTTALHRRLPGAHRLGAGGRDHGRHPQHRRRSGRVAGQETRRHGGDPVPDPRPRSATASGGCATAPSCWSVSPGRCGALNLPPSASNTLKPASAACA